MATVSRAAPAASLGRSSATVAGWTLVSRVTGLLRVVVVGAVLGPTFFANVFQSTNTLPNLVYTLIAGSVLSMVLVPAIVRAVASHGLDRATELVQRVLAVVVLAAGALAGLLILASPLLSVLLTGGIHDPAERRRAELFVVIFVVFMAPQVILYTIAAVGAAIQQASGRFALAAAAPALENVGLIVTCLFVAARYGTGREIGDVPLSMVMVLGVGSTLAVAAHTALQVLGARRAGLPVRWRSGWRHDHDARRIARQLRASIWVAALPSVGMLVMLVLAATVPGGVVVLQAAIAVYNVPTALGARAVSTAVLPGLSAAAASGDEVAYSSSWRRGLTYSAICGALSACLLVAFARPIANVLANGELRKGHLITLLAECVAILGISQFAAGIYEIGRQALFSRLDIRASQRASAYALVGMLAFGLLALGFAADHLRLAIVAVAFVIADIITAVVVLVRLRRYLHPHALSNHRELRAVATAVAVTLPAALAMSWVLQNLAVGRASELLLLGVCSASSIVLFGFVITPVMRRAPIRPALAPSGGAVLTDARPRAVATVGGGRGWHGGVDDDGWGGHDGGGDGGSGGEGGDGAGESGRRAVAVGARPRRTTDPTVIAVVVGAFVVALIAGVLSAVAGPMVIAGLVALLLAGIAAWRPIFVTYAYLLTLPFIAGIARGTLVPMMRPNEGLLGLLVAGALVGWYVRYTRGEAEGLRWSKLDMPLLVFAVLGTLWPLCWLLLRGISPSANELMAGFPIVKLAALLVLVRVTIQTRDQLLRCARFIIWPAVGLGLIAITQTLKFGPTISFLNSFWPIEGDSLSARGSATLASSIATGDYLLIALLLVVALGVRGLLDKRERIVAGLILATGLLAAGQFSTWVGVLVAGVVLATGEPVIRRAASRYVFLLPVVALVGAPAFITRISGFFDGFGVPRSWLGRWDNLTNFYLPRLGGFRFVLGVSPYTVLPAPETWRTEIFLESGYLNLLYVGGIPLFVAFIWLTVKVLEHCRQLEPRRDAVGASASVLRVTWWVVLVLSIIDSHLLLRGCGDLLVALLALTTGGVIAHGNDTRT